MSYQSFRDDGLNTQASILNMKLLSGNKVYSNQKKQRLPAGEEVVSTATAAAAASILNDKFLGPYPASGDGNVGDSNSSSSNSYSSGSGDRGRSRGAAGGGVARRDRNCRQYGSSTGHERNPAEQEQPEAMQPSTHRER
ncbi:hypothetical protein M0802_005053 [Mischocyttarus mexicanus]|nr:hypothetical protein M0802_005053 [Mischocyttarus mexicanus]